jgi:hypothetical protein
MIPETSKQAFKTYMSRSDFKIPKTKLLYNPANPTSFSSQGV